jgi:hypothetical protein
MIVKTDRESDSSDLISVRSHFSILGLILAPHRVAAKTGFHPPAANHVT